MKLCIYLQSKYFCFAMPFQAKYQTCTRRMNSRKLSLLPGRQQRKLEFQPLIETGFINFSSEGSEISFIWWSVWVRSAMRSGEIIFSIYHQSLLLTYDCMLSQTPLSYVSIFGELLHHRLVHEMAKGCSIIGSREFINHGSAEGLGTTCCP